MARKNKKKTTHHSSSSLSFFPLLLFFLGFIGEIIIFILHLLWEGTTSLFSWGKEKLFKKRSLPISLSFPSIGLPPQISLLIQLLPSLLRTLFWFILGGVATLIFLVIPTQLYDTVKALPNPQLLRNRDIPVTTKILDRKGVLLYEIYTNENRTPLSLSQIPDLTKKATIAIEDRDFYKHNGFSPKGILRAIKETILHDHIQGGSTITQQLIKTALLSPEVTLRRKIKEILLAVWAERMYTKDQILEMYLNQVPYGGTAWGIESASQTYFGKSVKNISLAETALLAGLPAAPSEYSPFGPHPEKAIERQKEVLRRMVEDGYIKKEEAAKAITEQLHFRTPDIPIRAPHFVMYVRDYLTKRYGSRMVEQGGLRVITSLDSELQDKVQAVVSTNIANLKSLWVGNGAALVTDPKTGGILAMVGSKDYFNMNDDGNVNVTVSLRQPGSSIKVITYSTALEHGFTAATLLNDSPVSYPIPGQAPYQPVNYDGRYHGLVPLRYALGNSYNIPAVRTLNSIGVTTMIEQGRKMGIDTWNDPSRFGLALTLGGGEVTMMDMAEVYGTLANGGKRIDLSPILEVTDYSGNVLEKGNLAIPVEATTPEIAWIMSNILSDNQARTQAFGPNSNLVIPGKTVSVKTGTTNDKRDNWTIGYTPSYVAVVWVGNNDNSPMNPYLTSGITGAAPIWQQIMKELLKDKSDEVQPRPEGIVEVPCYFGKVEYFVKGTEPKDGRCGVWPTITPSPQSQTELKPSISPLVENIPYFSNQKKNHRH